MSNPATVVLVHGAMNGPWVWEKVTPLLDDAGVPSILVNRGVGEPRQVSSDPRLDMERVREAVNAAARPVVLVGHSQGGIGITYGGAGNPFVRHLVYIDAFMPGCGVSVAEASAPELVAMLRVGEAGMTLDPDLARELVYGDCGPDDTSWALAHHDPQAPAPEGIAEPSELAWREKPTTYVRCTVDPLWRQEAAQAFAEHATQVAEWPTAHVPLVARPDLVAGLLADLAEQYAE